ncbi:MAG: hydrolase [Acidimicrobiales bacterium]|nr:MAG: hydrolase [Acidimicrobiales bacterium]
MSAVSPSGSTRPGSVRVGSVSSADDSPVAAVDIGTNSVRLLIADPAGATKARLMRITRLGEGVAGSGHLSEDAVQRTLQALEEWRRQMDSHGVGRARAVCTAAVREASNAESFLRSAASILGIEPEIVSGEEEARLSFVGATGSLDPGDGPFAVVDIGGGSTEFAVGRERCEGVVSIPVGCVRVTESFLAHDPPLPEELSAAISVIGMHLDDVVRSLPAVRDARTFVGLAGTITTVAAVELGIPEYSREAIHHFRLTRAAAEDVFRTLATESLEDRKANPGLEPERADVIVGGCCILVKIMRFFDLDEILVSEDDILDGIVASLLRDSG